MKVGIVCPYDWSHPGGVRTHILGQAAALRRRGVEVEVMAPTTNSEPDVYRLGRAVGVPANGSIARICFSHSASARLKTRLTGGGLDVLHLHEPAIPSVSLLALMAGPELPMVATFHTARDSSAGYLLARPLLKRFIDRLDGRIAVSEPARRFISRYFPADYRIVPNGVDFERYSKAAPDPDLRSLKPFVLFVGRPEPRKGFRVVLEAMEILRRRIEVPLVAVGGDPGRVPDWVVAKGPVSQEVLPGVYAAADVYCAPSLGGESFGLVLVEAMAAGTPVVASDIPGYVDASGGAALITPAGDAAALARALERVLTEPSVSAELRDKGRRRAQGFDWDRLIDEVLDLYPGEV